MRKLTAFICSAAMVLGLATTALANPSITTLAPETVEVTDTAIAQELEEKGLTLEVAEPNTEAYEKEEVADVVTKINDPKQTISVEEIVKALEAFQPKEEGQTEVVYKTYAENEEDQKVINPAEYKPVTTFTDLVLVDGQGNASYDEEGNLKDVEVKVAMEALKDVKAEDLEKLLIMQIDPITGEVFFIEVTEEMMEVDPVTGEFTGELTVKFPCCGPFMLISK